MVSHFDADSAGLSVGVGGEDDVGVPSTHHYIEQVFRGIYKQIADFLPSVYLVFQKTIKFCATTSPRVPLTNLTCKKSLPTLVIFAGQIGLRNPL